jgi:hypothetical protein
MIKNFTLVSLIACSFLAKGQSVDSVNFNSYISATNNDLKNKFIGSYSLVQQTTGGITGGSVLPQSTATPYNNAVYNKKYNYATAHPTIVSVCFKYNSAAATNSAVGPQVGLTLEIDSSTTIYSFITAYVSYDSPFGCSLSITGLSYSDNSVQFNLSTTNWYKLVLQANQISSSSSNVTASVYNLGASGTSAPSLVETMNTTVPTNDVATPKTYMIATMNGGADGGTVVLDNFNVSGYYYRTAVEDIRLSSHLTIPSVVTSTLSIKCDLNDDLEYAIYDINGKMAKKGKFILNAAVDISDIVASNYILKIVSGGYTYSQKFIKQ